MSLNWWKRKTLLNQLGPGLITGAADDDPSGIGTYSQVGAMFGWKFLWVALWTFPLMVVVQEICGRIGLVTRQGLAGILKANFPYWVVYPIVLVVVLANIVNIGADLQVMVEAVKLLIPGPVWLYYVIFLAFINFTFIYFGYQTVARVLKWLTIFLLTYVIVGISSVYGFEQWKNIFAATLIPNLNFDREQILLLVAVLGTTISPYLFFWQTSEEVEELPDKINLPRTQKKFLKQLRLDTIIGMLASNLAMWFIILTAGQNLHANGITTIQTAAEAASALAPIAGDWAAFIFAGGIIGTGLLAVPVLAGANAYALAELFNWPEGLQKSWSQARKFYSVFLASTILSLAILWSPWSPFEALIYTAAILGFILPFLLCLVMIISGRASIMGQYVNSVWSNFGGWLTVLLLTLATSLLVWW